MAERAEPGPIVEGARERILEAALDLFGERGLNGATVRDIAARAKVNVAAAVKVTFFDVFAKPISSPVKLRVWVVAAPAPAFTALLTE